jgi:hypothetical protein
MEDLTMVEKREPLENLLQEALGFEETEFVRAGASDQDIQGQHEIHCDANSDLVLLG